MAYTTYEQAALAAAMDREALPGRIKASTARAIIRAHCRDAYITPDGLLAHRSMRCPEGETTCTGIATYIRVPEVFPMDGDGYVQRAAVERWLGYAGA